MSSGIRDGVLKSACGKVQLHQTVFFWRLRDGLSVNGTPCRQDRATDSSASTHEQEPNQHKGVMPYSRVRMEELS
jgi:hypothetical protein